MASAIRAPVGASRPSFETIRPFTPSLPRISPPISGPSASNFFPDVWGSRALGGLNLTLVGATSRDLKRWGYSVKSVPSVDDRIRECIGLVFKEQVECWADLDTYATETIAAMVPVFFQLEATFVSARVRHFSFDQSTFTP